MNWLKNSIAVAQQHAQAAADSVLSSEAAAKARALAQQASVQARTLAEQAGKQAQAQLSKLGAFDPSAQNSGENLLDYAIASELQEFVRSLTYSSFSDYTALAQTTEDSGAVPAAGGSAFKLNAWQEVHARLVLQTVPQLQDLRFVLCPRRMSESSFWNIYFRLTERFLPPEAFDNGWQPPQPRSKAGVAAAPSAAAADAKPCQPGQATAVAPLGSGDDTGSKCSTSAAGLSSNTVPPEPAAAPAVDAAVSTSRPAAVNVDADETSYDHVAAMGDPATASPTMDSIDDDLELDAYLQQALHTKGGDGGAGQSDGGVNEGGTSSDAEDLDEYLHQLDAELQDHAHVAQG